MLLPSVLIELGSNAAFSIAVEEVKINGVDKGPTSLHVFYDEQGSAVLNFGHLCSHAEALSECEVKVRYQAHQEYWPLMVVKKIVSFDTTTPTVEARLSREPLILSENLRASKFEAVLFSAPRFFERPVLLKDSFGKTFAIHPTKSEEGAPCLIESNIALDPNDPLKDLGCFLNFLTFTKGSDCGFGNLFAFDENDRVSFKLLGFSRNDRDRREVNWFDIELQEKLPEVFSLFSNQCNDALANKAINQAINFYRASNASRKVSVEVAIIAAHSALEAIVNFILSHRAGWSKSLMDNRSIAFSEKSRAAAAHFGFSGDALERSPELLKFSKANSHIDVFTIISQFRNKLVHQETKTSLSGLQLHEVWLISQWLVEVLIFGLIGYRGSIIDRRIYNGWRGTTCQVPLTRT
jgi:hypothetical protein